MQQKGGFFVCVPTEMELCNIYFRQKKCHIISWD